MEAPNWYFEPEAEANDDEYIHVNDHLLVLSELECDVEQLVDELYDECENVDADIVHELILDLCKKLNMKMPNKNKLKLK